MIKNEIVNVLFTSSGRRVELVKHFKEAYKALNLEGKVYTADLKDNSPAGKISDEHLLVPRVNDPAYIDTLVQICKEKEISLIVPLIDTELVTLAENKALLEATGAKLLISSIEAHEICNDKVLTANFFAENNFGMPSVYDINTKLAKGNLEKPLLIKPAKGSSGIGVNVVKKFEELEFYAENLSEPILQELVQGDEYTIDVFTDFEGNILTAVPRLRIETRAGEVSKGKTIRNEFLIEQAAAVTKALPGAFGCITVQCFLTPTNEVKFIEINPRFGGGAPLSLAAGADYAKYLLAKLADMEIDFDINQWQNNLLMLRYDAAVFVTEE